MFNLSVEVLFVYLIIYSQIPFPTEITKYEGDELRKDGDVKKYLDVISNKNIKLLERVLIPVQQYPKVRQPNTVMVDLFLLFN